jgi:hypothetical protein
LENIWEKMKLAFTFEECLEADDSLLPCAVQEIEDKNTDIDDEEEAAASKPILNCSEAVPCLDMYHPDVPELSETSGN